MGVTAALRADRNNRLDGTFFSPRAALVFKPTESQNFRFTYNRAYSTPANFSFFLDLIQAHNAAGCRTTFARWAFLQRADGTIGAAAPRRWPAAYACVHPSVSTLGAANTYVDANAAAYYQTALAIVKPQLPASVAGARSHSERAQSHERPGGFGAALSRRQWAAVDPAS